MLCKAEKPLRRKIKIAVKHLFSSEVGFFLALLIFSGSLDASQRKKEENHSVVLENFEGERKMRERYR